jgi:hypothetical protein
VNWKPAASVAALLRTPARIALAVVFGGIAARVYLFLLGRSFWTDEAKLALNVVQRSFGSLFQPLDLDQAAPVGFLVLSKVMISLFGNSDFVLRILPLFAGCLALYLMYRLSFELLPPIAALLSVTLFTLGKFVLYYSTDFKQYSVDVAVGLALSLLTLRMMRVRPSGKDMLLLALAGTAGIFLSFPSVFVLAAAGLVLVVHFRRSQLTAVLSGLVLVGSAWIAVFGTLAYLILNSASANSELQSYWGSAFMPVPPWSDPFWLPSRIAALFVNPAGFLNGGPVTAVVFLFVAAGGAFSLLRRNWQAGMLLMLPMVFALAASALHRYPFSERLMLWAVPGLVLTVIEGTWWLLGGLHRFAGLQRIVWATMVAVFLASPIRDAAGDVLSPKARQHIKPLLAYLRSNRTPGESIYVYHKSRNPFLYYYPFYELSPPEFFLGSNFHGETDRYLREIGSMEFGRRVWILFSHVGPAGVAERDQIVTRLSASGQLTEVQHERSASLWLFDRGASLADVR